MLNTLKWTAVLLQVALVRGQGPGKGPPPNQGGGEVDLTSLPAKAPALGQIGTTVVTGTVVSSGQTIQSGANVYGPFEAGFTAQQDNVLAGLGCPTGSGYLPGGLDTWISEKIVAEDCDVELPRYTNDGTRISLLDSCGGHTNYHFHERLRCLYNDEGVHSIKIAEGLDGKGIYGKWEDLSMQEQPLLDACNGHYGVTPDSNGEADYHYHVQEYPPFTIGCYGPNADGSVVSVAQCRELYSDECGDNDVTTVATPMGNVQYDLWCPCFDADHSNTGTAELPLITGTATTSTPTTATSSTPTSSSTPTFTSTSTPTVPPTAIPTSDEEEEGFDFGSGCLAGTGNFSVTLKTRLDTQDLPGFIPAGKWGVRVNLFSANDIDIQLLDMQYTPNGYTEGAAIVAYCEAEPGETCNFGPLGTAPGVDSTSYVRAGMDAPLSIEYSGYNGDGVSLGNEYIQIAGVAPIPTKMRVYAYAPGPADVTYSWERSQSQCCQGKERCQGEPFSKGIVEGELATIGVIPVGKINVRIDLTSEGDVDVQIYNMDDTNTYSEGKAIIGYCAPPPGETTCNFGTLAGADRQEWVFDGVTYVYSGYNGVDGRLGDEYIEVIGTTNHPLLMKAYGYRSGIADVTYSWLEAP